MNSAQVRGFTPLQWGAVDERNQLLRTPAAGWNVCSRTDALAGQELRPAPRGSWKRRSSTRANAKGWRQRPTNASSVLHE